LVGWLVGWLVDGKSLYSYAGGGIHKEVWFGLMSGIILGIFRLVPQSVVSKSGFRKAATVSSPEMGL